MSKVHYNGNAYSIEVHRDTVMLTTRFVAVLTFAVFTCRRFDSAFLLPFWCRRFDLSLLWLVTVLTMNHSKHPFNQLDNFGTMHPRNQQQFSTA